MTGQLGNLKQQGLRLALEGGGLAPMVAIYQDGVLESEESLLHDIQASSQHPGVSRILKIKTTCERCARLAHFIQKWEESGAFRNYTLSLLPETFDPDAARFPDFARNPTQGGGCGSFVMGALLYSKILGGYGRTLRDSVTLPLAIDLNLVHSPAPLPEQTTFRKDWAERIASNPPQPLWKLPFKGGMQHWADPKKSSSAVEISATEPEFFYDWLTGAANQVAQESGKPGWIGRSHLSVLLLSSGDTETNLKGIREKQRQGRDWIKPYLVRGRAKLFSSQEAPYFGTPTLEVDLTEAP